MTKRCCNGTKRNETINIVDSQGHDRSITRALTEASESCWDAQCGPLKRDEPMSTEWRENLEFKLLTICIYVALSAGGSILICSGVIDNTRMMRACKKRSHSSLLQIIPEVKKTHLLLVWNSGECFWQHSWRRGGCRS